MLDAATRLFGTHQFHEVRMEDIATEAAVGKGTLYRYFHDKDELYRALVRRGTQQLMDRLRATAANSAAPRCRLIALVGGLVEFFDDNPHMLDLIQRTEALPGPEHPWRQTRMELSRLFGDLFDEAAARGEIRGADPELLILLLMGGLRNVIRFGARPRAANLAERIVTVFFPAGLGGHGPGVQGS